MSTTIDQSLVSLKESLIKMMSLVKSQLTDSQRCIIEQDQLLAQEIKQVEKIVNRFDSSIEKQCENIIALYNPVATDLRFVLACIRIGSSLERIGDLTYEISKYLNIKEKEDFFEEEILKTLKFYQLYQIAENQIKYSIDSFIDEDTEVARKVLLNNLMTIQISKELPKIIHNFLGAKKKDDIISTLHLFSILNKLIRISSLCANIAEETIYYIDAENLRHHKVKKSAVKQNKIDNKL